MRTPHWHLNTIFIDEPTYVHIPSNKKKLKKTTGLNYL